MKALQLLVALLLSGGTFAVSLGQGPADSRLYDFLKRPAYRESWNALFRGEKNVDSWLARYAETKDGPTSPEASVQLDGIRYEVANVCKTHDCGGNRFYVLFAPKGAKAWGFLLKDGRDGRFFGRPDDEKKNALRAIAARS